MYTLGHLLGSNPLVLFVFLILIILLVRIFGAWMLRINEVIKELKTLNETLKEKSK